MTHKPSKVAAAKMFFSIVYVIDVTCFDKCFLFDVIAGRRYFFWKFVITVWYFQPPYCRFLSSKYFERSPYFTHLHNNIAVLILILVLSSKKKLSYTILIYTWKTFVTDFFMITFFTLFVFLTVPHFSL